MDCSEDAGILQYVMNLSVFEFGREYGRCTVGEIDYGVDGYCAKYITTSNSDLIYCYTNYEYYQEINVVVDYCIRIGNYSVKMKRYQATEAQRLHHDDPAFNIHAKSGCNFDTYDGKC